MYAKVEVTQCFYTFAKVTEQDGWLSPQRCDLNAGDQGSHFLESDSVFLSAFPPKKTTNQTHLMMLTDRHIVKSKPPTPTPPEKTAKVT